jgi:hypothetical protein
MAKIGTYSKFIVALVGFVLTTATALDWGFDFPTWVPAVTSLVTALGVYLWPNSPYVQNDSDAALDNDDPVDPVAPAPWPDNPGPTSGPTP